MAKQRKILLVVNPVSGTDRKETIEALARERLSSQAGCDVSVAYTCRRGDATRLSRQAVSEGFYAVVAVGGDGTVNETARALCDSTTALGIIPCGSGNGLARHLGIPLVAERAIDILVDDNVLESDYGTVNGERFFCTFGVGFDAAVSDSFSRQHRRGKLSYIKSAIAEYVKYHPQVYTVSANGHVMTEKAFLIAVCNASQYGNNAYIAPHASLTDGMLDITIVQSGAPVDEAMVGLDLFTGYINSNTLIRTFRAPAAVIYRQQEGPAHIDGEPYDMSDIMEIKCHPGLLRIIAPREEKEFRPIITPMENMLHDIHWSVVRHLSKK